MSKQWSTENIARILRLGGVTQDEIIAHLVTQKGMFESQARSMVSKLDNELLINGIVCFGEDNCRKICRKNIHEGTPVTCIWPQ